MSERKLFYNEAIDDEANVLPPTRATIQILCSVYYISLKNHFCGTAEPIRLKLSEAVLIVFKKDSLKHQVDLLARTGETRKSWRCRIQSLHI